MNWIYRNDTDATVLYRSHIWLQGEAHEVPFPVPDSLGLTCIQQGDSLDLVLLHEDFCILPGAQEVINIPAPKLSHQVKLSIQCMTHNSGCECRFNSAHNCVIPIDVRDFQHVTSWDNCSRIFLSNTTENEVIISVNATEVV